MNTRPVMRCAIYTRKSTEEGLEQEFNSLHAQQEACAAYITSQKHEGWKAVRRHYEDGGFSGGNMERPALKQLLHDIRAGKINVIVVYKVDRLSRSLPDFFRMVEIFDKYNVSFVSITQQFNTTTSMGRLTLNILLSFAQFEREVSSERIRDKIASSKKKGMWMGGCIPLGYDLKDRKLFINTAEAEKVRMIYRRYLELGSIPLLKDDLDSQGIQSRIRIRNDGVQSGGCSFSRGALRMILSNPIYIGQVRHKGTCYPGQHDGLLDRNLWEQVQQHIARSLMEDKQRLHNNAPLIGKLFDTSGERLTTVYGNKGKKRHRYYVSYSLTTGPAARNPLGWRLPALKAEQMVMEAAKNILNDRSAIATTLQEAGIKANKISGMVNAAAAKSSQLTPDINIAEVFTTLIKRVELQENGIRLTLSLESFMSTDSNIASITITRDIPMVMQRRSMEVKLVFNNTAPTIVDQVLINNIARARAWLQDLLSGQVKSITEIALREGTNKSFITKRLSLAFLSPRLLDAIVAGKEPADLLIDKLVKHTDLPLEWNKQRHILGFAAPQMKAR